MKKAVLVTIGLMVVTFMMAQQGMGQRKGYGHGRGPDQMDRKEMMKEKLNLSEDQEKQMKSIQTKYLGEIQSIENQLDIKRAELKAAISAEESRKVIDGFVSEINSLNGQRFEKEIERMLEVRGILDEEQKVIFDAMAGKLWKGQRRQSKRSK